MKKFFIHLCLFFLLLPIFTTSSWGREILLGQVRIIDAPQQLLRLETLPTLFSQGGEFFTLDLSRLQRSSWKALQSGDTIRVWVTDIDQNGPVVVESLQVQSLSRQPDPTGIRRRLSRGNGNDAESQNGIAGTAGAGSEGTGGSGSGGGGGGGSGGGGGGGR